MALRLQHPDDPLGGVLKASAAGVPVDISTGIGNGPVIETGIIGAIDTALQFTSPASVQAIIEDPVDAAKLAAGVVGTIVTVGTASPATVGLIASGGAGLFNQQLKDFADYKSNQEGGNYVAKHLDPTTIAATLAKPPTISTVSKLPVLKDTPKPTIPIAAPASPTNQNVKPIAFGGGVFAAIGILAFFL